MLMNAGTYSFINTNILNVLFEYCLKTVSLPEFIQYSIFILDVSFGLLLCFLVL